MNRDRKLPTSGSGVSRADGVTDSERYLKKLCDRTFLSLWSYPGVYRDQGRSGKGHGKEVCDLLVVFENHVIVFSDKDCAFPNSGDLVKDWSRWFRKAIKKSADQVWGAERWIKEHPNHLFIDRACEHEFPIDLPDPGEAIFHRIFVAHDSADRCRLEFGGAAYAADLLCRSRRARALLDQVLGRVLRGPTTPRGSRYRRVRCPIFDPS